MTVDPSMISTFSRNQLYDHLGTPTFNELAQKSNDAPIPELRDQTRVLKRMPNRRNIKKMLQKKDWKKKDESSIEMIQYKPITAKLS